MDFGITHGLRILFWILFLESRTNRLLAIESSNTGLLSLVKSTILILESGFIGVNLSGFLVDKFKRLKLVALFCVTMCKYLYQKIVFDKNIFLDLIY